MLCERKWTLGLTLLVMVAAASWPDKAFCPLAPSPVAYRQNLGMRVINGKMSNEPLDARVAARLVNAQDVLVGWVYWDEDGIPHIVLKTQGQPGSPFVPHTNLLAAGIKIRSCFEAD
jgi:hypothetical protein